MVHKTGEGRVHNCSEPPCSYIPGPDTVEIIQFTLCDDNGLWRYPCLYPWSLEPCYMAKGVKAAGGKRLLIRDLESQEILGQAGGGSQKGPGTRPTLAAWEDGSNGENIQIKQNQNQKQKPEWILEAWSCWILIIPFTGSRKITALPDQLWCQHSEPHTSQELRRKQSVVLRHGFQRTVIQGHIAGFSCDEASLPWILAEMGEVWIPGKQTILN